MYFSQLIPRHHIKTYHTLYDVTEYYVDTAWRVIVVTHLSNGNTYEKIHDDAEDFLSQNKGKEIATLIAYHLWPM